MSQEPGKGDDRADPGFPPITPGETRLVEGGELTRREATTKEHVEEVLRGDVRLEASVEVPVPVAMPGCLALVITELVVLLPLLRVAEYRVCGADGWEGGGMVSRECWG